eukprot:TRINITY_DN1062_c0_g2_i2.p3 TRINITY_DN1062_c0_g2~~TRINITY_DN1062_c0_g2_i2.p3  ORF type:complete len:102 (+),score=37.25 TRINITY_DN1062_c0_g2_i2:70-375(+)
MHGYPSPASPTGFDEQQDYSKFQTEQGPATGATDEYTWTDAAANKVHDAPKANPNAFDRSRSEYQASAQPYYSQYAQPYNAANFGQHHGSFDQRQPYWQGN